MIRTLLAAWVVAYLPGALAYRAPVASRDRRAAVDAGERVFWHVILSVAWSLAVVLVLAALGQYRFERLLLLNVGVAAALLVAFRGRLAYRGSASRPTAAILLPLLLLGLGAWRFFPPSEYVMGGKDPGVYFNEGVQIAQRGALVMRDAAVATTRPEWRPQFFPLSGSHLYESRRFMGFFVQDLDTGRVVGQFPHLFPASIAIGYGLDGLTGARRAVGWWTMLGVLAVYFAGARIVGRTSAFAGAGLLALHVITMFFARYPNAEVVMLALLFAALLALARAVQDADPFFAPVAGALLGVLLFLRIDVLLAVVAVVSALLAVVAVQRRWPGPGFFLPLAAAMGLAFWYYADLMRGYLDRPAAYLQHLPTAPLVAGLAAAAGALVLTWRYSRRQPARVQAAVPLGLLVVLSTAAAYAYWLREPGGRLAIHDAHALRTFVDFYLQPLGLAAVLVGLWITARRDFWRDPALFVTFSAFSLFLFYKIKIVPEHFWMARRFLPVILPVALLMIGAAAFGPRVGPPLVSAARRVVGAAIVIVLGWQYAAAARPVVGHVEYAGMIPHLEALAGRIGDRDLVLVESGDAGFDTHVFATPLAYIYDRQVLELPNARPDKIQLRAFLGDAARRYDRLWFLGGGGTDLRSRQIGAVAVHDERFSVPEFDSPMNAYPEGVRRKDFQYTLYQLTLDPPVVAGFVLDVGERDDLHVVRFHAKERNDDRSVRWTQDRSLVSVPGLSGSETTLVLTLHDGGRPAQAGAARVTVVWNETPIATIDVASGFREYQIALPPALVAQAAAATDPISLRLDSTTWVPARVLGGSDTRELGVMVDRVEVR